MIKQCVKCNVIKDESEFYKCSRTSDGLGSYCKKCSLLSKRETIKKFRIKNKKLTPEEIKKNTKKKKCYKCKKVKNSKSFYIDISKGDGLSTSCKTCAKQACKKFFDENPDYTFKHNREYYKKNKKKIKEINNKYRLENKDRLNLWQYEYEKNPQIRIKKRITTQMRETLFFDHVGPRKRKNFENMVGCTIEFFKSYIESKFKVGMTWKNYGEWQLDHIKPTTAFDLMKVEEQKKCFYYKNTQPLWKEENISKGSNYKGKRYRLQNVSSK